MIIGVTGGVGSGKSSIMRVLGEKGAHLIIADDVARELQEPGNECYKLIIDNFGERILSDETSTNGLAPIDRKKLASVVFADDKKLELLNSLTHPQVKTEILRRIDQIYSEDPDALIAIEAALLIQAGYLDMLDELWVITCDHDIRVERLMSSRDYSREKAESIMASQMSDEEYSSYADFVLDNSGTHAQTKRKITNRLKKILSA